MMEACLHLLCVENSLRITQSSTLTTHSIPLTHGCPLGFGNHVRRWASWRTKPSSKASVSLLKERRAGLKRPGQEYGREKCTMPRRIKKETATCERRGWSGRLLGSEPKWILKEQQVEEGRVQEGWQAADKMKA